MVDKKKSSLYGIIHHTGPLLLVFLLLSTISLRANTLEAGKEKKTLTFGVDELSAPFAFRQKSDGKLTGFNIDLISALAAKCGFTAQIKSYQGIGGLIEALDKNEVDIAAGVCYTKERLNRYKYTAPFCEYSSKIYQLPDFPIPDLDALSKMKIIAVEKGISAEYLKERGLGGNIIYADTTKQALLMLSAEKGDCAFLATIPANYQLKQLGINTMPSDILTYHKEICLAANKENQIKMDCLSSNLNKMKAYVKVDSLYNKWIAPYNGEKNDIAAYTYIIIILLCILFICLILLHVMRRKARKRARSLEDAIDALLETEKNLEMVVKNADVGMWEWNVPKNLFTFYEKNCRGEEIGGYRKITISRDELYSNIYPTDLSTVRNAFQSFMLGTQDVFEVEHRVQTNGTTRWIMSRGKAIRRDHLNIPLLVAGTHLDITSRKEIEDALKQSEEKYRTVIENIHDVFFKIDTNRRFEMSSPSVYKLLGLTSEELLDTPFSDISPDTRNTELFFTTIIAEDAVYDYELSLKHKNGKLITASISARILKDNNANPLGIEGICRDITGRKLAEQMILKKDKMLEATAASAGILLTGADLYESIGKCMKIMADAMNADRAYLFENRIDQNTGKRYTSQKIEYCANGAHSEMNNPDTQNIEFDDPAVKSFIMPLASKQIVAGLPEDLAPEEELILQKQNIRSIIAIPLFIGNEFWGFIGLDDCHNKRIWNDAEKSALKSFASSLSEAVQRKMKENELLIAREAAEAASKAKSRFLANVTHEIRTPMNAVLGMTSFLTDSRLTPEQQECVQTISQNINSLISIVNDILDYSKIESRSVSLENIQFNIRSVVDSLNDTYAPMAFKKDIDYICTIGPELPSKLYGDPSRIKQALSTIVANSIKFTDKGFVYIDITANDIQNDICNISFSIRDTGIGISPEAASNIFTPFSQGDLGYNKKYGGTGLSLSICKQIIDMCGGHITFSQPPGGGTIFSLTIPFKIHRDAYTTGSLKRPASLPPAVYVATACQMTAIAISSMLTKLKIKTVTLDINKPFPPLPVDKIPNANTQQYLILDANLAQHTPAQLENLLLSIRNSFKGQFIIFSNDKIKLPENYMTRMNIATLILKPGKLSDFEKALSSAQENVQTSQDEQTYMDEDVFDETLALSHVDNDRELLRQVLELFFEDSLAHCNDIDKAIALADMKKTTDQAHTLKSSSRTVGARKINRLCVMLETYSREQAPISKIKQAATDLKSECSRFAELRRPRLDKFAKSS